LLLFIYILLGPAAWLALCVMSLFARVRMGRLLRSTDTLPAEPPSIAIVVPAKDEAENIRSCVSKLLQQDYPRFELVVVNDRSTDSTGSQLDEMATQIVGGPRLRVIHIESLPEGWLGKSHALHVATRGLTHDYLLFVDSDVNLASDAARKLVALAHARSYDALSALPSLEFAGLADRLLLPVLAVSWGAAFTVSLTNDDSKRHIAAANGQMFLIRRDVYERVGNHQAVRNKIVEDVELMRHLKKSGASVRFMLGHNLGSTKMHDTWPRIFHGWARIFAGTARRSIWPILAVLFFLWVCTMPVFAALWMPTTAWRVASISHLLLIAVFVVRCYTAAGLSIPAAILLTICLPVTIILQSVVLIYAMIVCIRGHVMWRCDRVAG